MVYRDIASIIYLLDLCLSPYLLQTEIHDQHGVRDMGYDTVINARANAGRGFLPLFLSEFF